MIEIHLDFHNGDEVSLEEGKLLGDNFSTLCTEFFSTETVPNVIVLKKDGSYIDRDELLKNTGEYTNKEIRTAHNIQRMLTSNSFNLKRKINNMKTIKDFNSDVKKSSIETRHYSLDSLMKRITLVCGTWNTINISDDKELIQRLWDNHISKMSHLHYCLSEMSIGCIIETPRGKNYLRWSLSGGEPIWLEYGLYDSGTRYDINYPKDFEKCQELRTWLIENGKRFRKMYESDKNL